MIDLNSVVQAISERGLKLIRTADSIRIEGDCPAELAEAIQQHQQSLLPFAAVDPDAAEQAAATADNVRQQLDAFGDWLLSHALWAALDRRWSNYLDERTAASVDTQDAEHLAETIARLREELEVINWAATILPRSYEVEAKHAAESGAMPIDDNQSDDEIPF